MDRSQVSRRTSQHFFRLFPVIICGLLLSCSNEMETLESTEVDIKNYDKRYEASTKKICEKSLNFDVVHIKGELLPIMHNGIVIRTDVADAKDIEVNFDCIDKPDEPHFSNLVYGSLYGSEKLKYSGLAIYVPQNTSIERVCDSMETRCNYSTISDTVYLLEQFGEIQN